MIKQLLNSINDKMVIILKTDIVSKVINSILTEYVLIKI